MTDISSLFVGLNWRLGAGSHEFPGPLLCINEAAVIAAGLPYRQIKSAYDCPPCFSRALASYLLALNDEMDDSHRQKLIRFVLRLAGSTDSLEIEKARAELIALRTVQRILPPMLRGAARYDVAATCETATTIEAAVCAAKVAADVANCGDGANAAFVAALYARKAISSDDHTRNASRITCAADYAARATQYVAGSAFDEAAAFAAWDIAIELAEEAFAIGTQASPPAIEQVSPRRGNFPPRAFHHHA